MAVDVNPTTTAAAPVTPGSSRFHDLAEAVRVNFDRRAESGEVNPFDSIQLIREYRFGAFRIPVELGGAGASFRQLFAALIELAAADPDVPHILRNHFVIVDQQLIAPESETRETMLAQAEAGRIFSDATTELGKHTVGEVDFDTTVLPAGDHYILDGTKYYTTGCLYSDLITVSAVDGYGKFVKVLVPADREGVRREDDWDGMGQRGTGSGTTHFEAVEVAPEEIMSGFDELFGAEASYLPAIAQLWLHAIAAGVLRGATDDAVALVRRRQRTFSHAPSATTSGDPLLQLVVGQIAATAAAARAVVLDAADALDAAYDSVEGGGPDPQLAEAAAIAATQVKVHLDEVGPRATTALFEVGGASATKRSANLDRHWRNVRTLGSHNPTLYKAQALGDLLINGNPLPKNGAF